MSNSILENIKKNNLDKEKFKNNPSAYFGTSTIGENVDTTVGDDNNNDDTNKDDKKGKNFLTEKIGDYFKYFEKSDTDKMIDFAKTQGSPSAQFGTFGSDFSTEVAKGLNIYNPGSPNQQMFIPGEKAQGKTLFQRFAGAAVGLGKGLLSGTPHGGAIGAGIGFFS